MSIILCVCVGVCVCKSVHVLNFRAVRLNSYTFVFKKKKSEGNPDLNVESFSVLMKKGEQLNNFSQFI